MKNWKSTISGAFAALGTFLFGAPVALAVCGSDLIPLPVTRVLVVTGFLMSGLGIFFGHLFSADAKSVSDLKTQVDATAEAVKTGDTSFLERNSPPQETKEKG